MFLFVFLIETLHRLAFIISCSCSNSLLYLNTLYQDIWRHLRYENRLCLLLLQKYAMSREMALADLETTNPVAAPLIAPNCTPETANAGFLSPPKRLCKYRKELLEWMKERYLWQE